MLGVDVVDAKPAMSCGRIPWGEQPHDRGVVRSFGGRVEETVVGRPSHLREATHSLHEPPGARRRHTSPGECRGPLPDKLEILRPQPTHEADSEPTLGGNAEGLAPRG
jgi:hypothetical protein